MYSPKKMVLILIISLKRVIFFKKIDYRTFLIKLNNKLLYLPISVHTIL